MIACMMVLMVLAYTFMRTRYLLFVTFMTPYVLILLYILNPVHFTNLIADRVIDTGIGSGIAVLANILFSPEWVYTQFGEYLQQMLEANKMYFSDATSSFTGNTVGITRYKLSRKHAYVALANISDALNRMLAEPKSKQRNAAGLNQIVVLNYMLASHTATLDALTRDRGPVPTQPDYSPVIRTVIHNLNRAVETLTSTKMAMPLLANSDSRTESMPVSEIKETRNAEAASANNPADNMLSSVEWLGDFSGNKDVDTPKEIRQVNEEVAMLVSKRKSELEQGIRESETSRRITLVKSVNDQFNFIWKISVDLVKIVAKVNIICFLYFAEKFL
jgi:uncharacterized membrane protein YccC